MIEIWKTIKNWPYLISDRGRVISPEKEIKGRWGVYIKKSIFLRQKINKFGYHMIVLQDNKKKRHAFIHVLVAEAFIGEKKIGTQVNHKDCNKSNNCAENLEYLTPKENTIHAYKNGCYPDQKGESHGGSKLTDSIVKKIRTILNQKAASASQLSKRYGVSQATISLIKTRKIWNHI